MLTSESSRGGTFIAGMLADVPALTSFIAPGWPHDRLRATPDILPTPFYAQYWGSKSIARINHQMEAKSPNDLARLGELINHPPVNPRPAGSSSPCNPSTASSLKQNARRLLADSLWQRPSSTNPGAVATGAFQACAPTRETADISH